MTPEGHLARLRERVAGTPLAAADDEALLGIWRWCEAAAAEHHGSPSFWLGKLLLLQAQPYAADAEPLTWEGLAALGEPEPAAPAEWWQAPRPGEWVRSPAPSQDDPGPSGTRTPAPVYVRLRRRPRGRPSARP